MRARAMSYTEARRLVAAAGTIVILALTAVMYLRRVETAEVVAVVLFFPIFLAVLRWNVAGGAIAAAAAGAVYTAIRWPAIRAVGFGTFSGLVTSRLLGFIVFGVLGGWANGELRASLTKLDLYDQIDDATSLFNARFFIHQIDLEAGRATRYRTFFAVASVDIPAGWFASLGGRAAARVLRDLGRLIHASVRTVDYPVHARINGRERLAVILPETGESGAQVFVGRLREQLVVWLRDRGVSGDGDLEVVVAAVPGDEDVLAQLRSDFAAADHIEHPLAPAPQGS